MLEAAVQQMLNEAVVSERVRIYNELYKHSSIECVYDGGKQRQIFSMGVAKLEEIVMPKLPEEFQPIESNIEAPTHPSFINDMSKKAIPRHHNLKAILAPNDHEEIEFIP